jgi:hypothetical protein
VTVPESDIDAEFAKNVARYPNRKMFNDALSRANATAAELRQELRRRLLIAKVHDVQVTSRCKVDRTEARRYFGEHPEKFVEPEQLHIFAITVGVDPSSGDAGWKAGKAKADDVRKQLANGASFEELAKKFSTDPSAPTGGDMGVMHRGSLSKGFDSVAEHLAIGEASPVVETIYGYHIIKVTEILPARPRSFDDVGGKLEQDLTDERCTASKDAWISGLRAAATITYPK